MADYVDCDNNATPLEDILKSMFTKDAAGNIGIRVVTGVDDGVAAVTCDNGAQMSLETLMKLSIEATPNGPALRLLE